MSIGTKRQARIDTQVRRMREAQAKLLYGTNETDDDLEQLAAAVRRCKFKCGYEFAVGIGGWPTREQFAKWCYGSTPVAVIKKKPRKPRG